MSEIELTPCKRCGHTPLEMFGLGIRRYFCAHCCHEFEKTVSAPWRLSQEDAAAAWNKMQLNPPVENILESTEEKDSGIERWTVKDDIDQILDKVRAVSEVSKAACQRTGSDYVTNVLRYIHTEMAIIRDRLYEIKREETND